MRRALLRWGPALAWAATIFWLSSRSTLPHLPGVLGWDKLGHFVAYAAGGFLIVRALAGADRAVLLALAIGSLHGVLDEFHQSFVPNRTPDVRDWIADTIGIAVGIYLFHLYTLRRERRTAAEPSGATGT